MSNTHDDLPVNPAGISFEDWAALLTGGSLPNSGLATPTPGPTTAPAPTPDPTSAAPVPPAVVPAATPVVPPAATPAFEDMSFDDFAQAFEASWSAPASPPAAAPPVSAPAPVPPMETVAPVAPVVSVAPAAPVAPAQPIAPAAPVDSAPAEPAAAPDFFAAYVPPTAVSPALAPAESLVQPAALPEPASPSRSTPSNDSTLSPLAMQIEAILESTTRSREAAMNQAQNTIDGQTPPIPATAPPLAPAAAAAAAAAAAIPAAVPGTIPAAPFAVLPPPAVAAAPPLPAETPFAAPVATPPAADAAPAAMPAAPAPAPAAVEEPAAAFAAPAEPAAAPAAPAARAAAPAAPATPDAEAAPRSARDDGADPDLVAALREVVLQGASDLHVTANAAPSIRLHGGLRPLPGEAWTSDKVRAALLTLLSPAQKQKFERELELDFAYAISANARFRVNIYQQRANIGAAFRLIPTEIKQLAELGVPESVARFATLPRGLVLVTGPTGSGKSTTLAALIDLVNSTRADHIVTVEDPIEFMHNHKKSLINQREVGHDTHSFASALKHVLRQDPDVILVGELRDLETISVALTAAETGHLVFATLHTQSAAQTIDRIIDVYPPHQQNQVRAQLAATLQGVVCQTLIKKASGQGRVVATEVLITTPAVSNLIREGQTHQVPTAMQAGGSFGMHTLDQHLADLVNRGVITQGAAVDKAHDPESMLSLVHNVETRASSMSQTGVDFGDAYSGRGRH